MKDHNCKTETPRIRALSRRLFHPVSAAAIIGIAGSLAVTPLMALGLVEFSAGLVAMPGTVQASVAGPEAMSRLTPRDTVLYPEPADRSRAERSGRVSRATATGNRIAAQRTAPHFADFDPRRLTTPLVAEKPSQATKDYAWISGDSASVTLASLDQRFAVSTSLAALETALPAIAAVEVPGDDELSVPVPEQRPRIATASARDEDRPASAATASAAPEPRRADPPRPEKGRSGAALAYANPDAAIEEDRSGGIFGRLFGGRNEALLPGRGSKVAVYDIGSATVYMPNGEKLEAHSGFGHMKDDPRYVAEKNKGPTPPNLYNLRMREARFHGVEAIRLLPADGKKKFNRDGLLAHTYMYVRGGGMDKSQSNGCVAIKDYDKFLAAFKRGQIEHLIVVPHLKEVPTYMAAL